MTKLYIICYYILGSLPTQNQRRKAKMDPMTEKEFNIFSLITTILVFTSALVGVSTHNEVKSTDNAARPKTMVESSYIATSIYTEALVRQGEYEAWELARKDARDRDILLFCSLGSKYGDCLKFWSKLADDQFIVESLRVISQGKNIIVFSEDNYKKILNVSNEGMVFVSMSTTIEDIKNHLRSRG